MFKIFVIFLLNSILSYGNCANILALMGVPSPSHHIWNSVLLHELADRGHNVTILSVDLPKVIPDNVHYIHLEETYKLMWSEDENHKVDINAYIGVSPFITIPMFYVYGKKAASGALHSKGLNVLLNYSDTFKFDLIINDFTIAPYLLGFAHKFKYPPIVGLSAFLYPPMARDQVGGHFTPAYVPYHETSYDTKMSFFERMYNHILFFYDTFYRLNFAKPMYDKMMRDRYPSDMPYLGDIEKKTIIALVNSHPAVTYPESMPPNVIEVGGMQIKDPKPLPKDLEMFIQSSKKGAILFSLGTNIRGADLGEAKLNSIISAMELLPEYNFLWKIEENCITRKLPKNILSRPFLPQSDILAHPKIKSFVSHGGGLSTQEAIWRGVPIIGIPLFMDQIRNLHKCVLLGVAERVKFSELNAKVLRDTIKNVTENEFYSKNMKIRSALFRDRPMKPLDTAVWWIEYVLRNPDTPHLKSPTVNMSFFVANSLDFIFISIAFIFIVIYILIKFIYSIVKYFNTNPELNKKKKVL